MRRVRAFDRRRDGSIEVRLTPFGRSFVVGQFERLRDADGVDGSGWRSALHPPIDPALNDDDPLRALERQEVVTSNADLALITAGEPSLSEGEAWAWLSSLQLALRAHAADQGLESAEDLEAADPEALEEVLVIQQLLFDLAAALG